MAIDSRAKGANFELAVAEVLSKWWGKKLRRTPGSGGWSKQNVTGDIAAGEDFPFSVECKATESWEFYHLLKTPDNGELIQHWEQCITDAGGRQRKDPRGAEFPLIPLLVFKRNFHPMYAALRLDDFANIAKGNIGAPTMTWLYKDEEVVFTLLEPLLKVIDPSQFK